MKTIDKIALLMRHIESGHPVHSNYSISDDALTHTHYGWKTQSVKTFREEADLLIFLDIVALDYANQMRVPKRLVLQGINRETELE